MARISVRLSDSTDSRLLLAGVVAVLALVAYLSVAFANTHAASGPISGAGNPFAPWVPHGSRLARIPVRRRLAVRVTPAATGNFGALVPTLLSDPKSGRTYIVGLWLKAARPGRIGVSVDEFAPGATSVYLVNTTVRATRRWRHFAFRARVEGTWLGLGMYVYGEAGRPRRAWFAVRNLTAALSPR